MIESGTHRNRILMMVMAVFLILFPAVGITAAPLEVGILHLPPYYVIHSIDNVEGIITLLLRNVMEKAGIDYTMKGYPPKRLYFNLAEGSTHIFVGIKDVPIYDGKVFFSSMKVSEIELRVYTLKNNFLPTKKEEFNHRRVITIRGYSYGNLISYLEDPVNDITIDPVNTHESAFKKLIRGRGDLLLNYKEPVIELISEEDQNACQYHVMKVLPLYFIVSKKTPEAMSVMEKLETAYLSLYSGNASRSPESPMPPKE